MEETIGWDIADMTEGQLAERLAGICADDNFDDE